MKRKSFIAIVSGIIAWFAVKPKAASQIPQRKTSEIEIWLSEWEKQHPYKCRGCENTGTHTIFARSDKTHAVRLNSLCDSCYDFYSNCRGNEEKWIAWAEKTLFDFE